MTRRENFIDDHRRIIAAALSLGFMPTDDAFMFDCTDEQIVAFAEVIATATTQQLLARIPAGGSS